MHNSLNFKEKLTFIYKRKSNLFYIKTDIKEEVLEQLKKDGFKRQEKLPWNFSS